MICIDFYNNYTFIYYPVVAAASTTLEYEFSSILQRHSVFLNSMSDYQAHIEMQA